MRPVVSLIFVSTLFLVVRIVDAITNPFMGREDDVYQEVCEVSDG